ncbi:MAG: tetratricopeptide repeat protein [Polyangiaceae bacterium]|nr:tetratricopeptide repeat protein [Polyangiaceae bacterium]
MAARRPLSEPEHGPTAMPPSFIRPAVRRPSHRPRPAAREASGLPPALTSFVGRGRERSAIDRALGSGARLVTLVGPGGAGKTRLAVEWARGRRAETGDRAIFFCDLTEARSLEGVCVAVASALGVPMARGAGAAEHTAQLGLALAGHEGAVVVLDNFEQVVAHGAATVGRWLVDAPDAVLVVTSRSPLGLPGEQVCEVGSLGLPAPGAEVRGADAVELFVERARAVRVGYEPSVADAREIAAVVARLDGLPLAIELAAARMRVLTPRQIAQHLERRFELLGRAPAGVPARHATLRAAIDWSWDLLEPAEQSALAQCAVFRGGFDLEAAMAVVELPGSWALDAIHGLCERSLVHAYEPPDGDGELRYRLYESVREYAAERLQASDTALRQGVLGRHDAHYQRLARETHASAALRGRPRALQLLAWELENLVSVHARALAAARGGDVQAHVRALDIAIALEPLVLARGPLGLGLEVLGRALEGTRALAAAEPALCARAELARAHVLAELGREAESLAARLEAHALAVRSGDGRLEGRVLASLARHAWHAADLERAVELCEAALVLHRAALDRTMEGRTLSYRASALHARGLFEAARGDYERALSVLRAEGDRQGEAVTLGHLGRLEHDAGDCERARVRYAQAIDTLRSIGDRYNEASFVAELGNVALELEDGALAHGLYERALAAHREVGNQRAEGLGLAWLGRAAELEGMRATAREHYAAAAERLGPTGHPLAAGLLACWRARLAADSDELEAARELHAAGVALSARVGDAPLVLVGELTGAHLALAAGRRAPSAAEAATHFQAAVAAGERARGAVRGSAEVRLALRALERALAGHGLSASHATVAARPAIPPPSLPRSHAPHASHASLAAEEPASQEEPGAPSTDPHPPRLSFAAGPPSAAPTAPGSGPPSWATSEILWVSASGRAFRLPGGERVDIATRGPLRRILAALADRREQAPGVALGRDELVALGWPGERMHADAAAGRVYAAVATLRRLGLRELLERRDDGYLLSADVPLVRGGEGPDSSRGSIPPR